MLEFGELENRKTTEKKFQSEDLEYVQEEFTGFCKNQQIKNK